ncbi:hypothetical protein GPEL0_01r3536 [Geoanaerobacter pelophilus]|uniref:Uncharacterized protein n=1 Tax=Geoanaerobacter pelophilus TaxID=60036 RepID=A0ABQ0MKJ8_9BACT|nr:hypothetical protein GPEL0_01r3536 [Geoanaerobacter pelophilus]
MRSSSTRSSRGLSQLMGGAMRQGGRELLVGRVAFHEQKKPARGRLPMNGKFR